MKRKSFFDLSNDAHDAMGQLLIHPERFPGWLSTVAFYKSLSIVNLYVDASHLRNDHRTRNDVLRRLYPKIYKPYQSLFKASLIARYLRTDSDAYKSCTDFMTPEDVVDILILKKLHAIEQICIEQLTPEERASLKQVSRHWVTEIKSRSTLVS